MIAVGKFADFWGKKPVFYVGILLFAIAAFGAGFSNNIPMLVFFRGLQSAGAATVFIASAALLSDVFPEQERVRAISIYAGVTGLGLLVGPFFGGVLISLLDWRWVFWINLPLIVAGLAICSFSLRGRTEIPQKIKIDWLGLLLLIFGLGSLMYGIIDSAQMQWKSISAWAFLIAGIAALVTLLILDNIKKNPLLDLHIFKEKIIVLTALACSLGGVVSNVFMFFDPLYLRNLRQLPPFWIGLLVAVIPAAQVLISFIFNRLVNRFGVVNLLFSSVIAAFVAALLHRFIELHTSYLFLILPFFLLGVNWGLSNSSLITAINQVIVPKEIGAALGTIATIWNVVGSLILAISSAIFHAVETKSSFLPAYHSTIVFIIIFSGAILLASIWIRLKLAKR